MERNRIRAALALCVAAGALLPSFAAAEETKVLHKCVDAKGITSIQANACAKGSTEAWARPAQTEAKPTEADVAAAREREARNQAEVLRQAAALQQSIAPPKPTPAPGSQLAGSPGEGSQPAPASLADAGTPAPAPAAVISNCQVAQNFAAEVREKTWLGVTNEQMQRIYGWVQDQCRVQTSSDP